MSWFHKKKKAPPEQLVLGAKLHCPLAVGDVCSYLWVDTKILDINHVPPANVDDCVAMHNIMPFGNCNAGGGTCDVCMKFDSPWKNREPQGILVDGKEAINMKSILVCSHGPGISLDIKSSGQDHLFVSQIIFMKEMDQKYPGLRKILEDPGGSLYLNDGMYQMALQFLEDRINADGGAVSLYILDDKDNPEAYYIKSALGHLEPAVNVTGLQTYVDGFNAIMGKYDDATRMTIDDHSLNGAMLNLLKRDCDDNNKWIQKGGFYRWQEEHKGDLALLADWMRGAVDCSMMAASMISSGPGASVDSVEGEGWSEDLGNTESYESMCFAKGTLIAMKNGYKSIELIEKGDLVLSKNIISGEIGYKRVKQLFINEAMVLYIINLSNQNIFTTMGHPFYVLNKGWVKAESLSLDDQVWTEKGTYVKIHEISIISLDKKINVYNFEVEDWHTYFVSTLDIWVHNDCSVGAGQWHQGGFKSPEESLEKHFEKHGAEVGATNVEQYLNKAQEFARNLRGARKKPVPGVTPGVIRYYKNGKYIDMVDGKIISFGKQ